ncbi:hypothetical protein DPF_0463 [Desulfoplanes formicivorans]|uniref:Uncharacterized protein n=1 Tax=Desulfoplanes formicivorans TaxID=1592317 RepID=A0A194AG60_9BACT|nr:hypothetical protein DPF_0463 [Desulfoplanes formicivorans]
MGMFRAAFAILWDMDKSWLMWRLPILAIEEVWQYAGRVPDHKDPCRRASVKTDVHDFLETLCLSVKDHSTYALLVLLDLHGRGRYAGPDQEPFKRRWHSLVRMIAYRNAHGDEAVARAILDKATTLENPEARDIARTCMDRFAIKGGMEGDRTMALIGGFLALTSYTGLPSRAQPAHLSEPADWPWWVYDHHTSVGKHVFPRVAQELGMSKTELTRLSFAFTGGIRTPVAQEAFWPLEMDRVLDRLHPGRHMQWNRVRGAIRQALVDQIRQDPLEQPLTLPFT